MMLEITSASLKDSHKAISRHGGGGGRYNILEQLYLAVHVAMVMIVH